MKYAVIGLVALAIVIYVAKLFIQAFYKAMTMWGK